MHTVTHAYGLNINNQKYEGPKMQYVDNNYYQQSIRWKDRWMLSLE